MESNNKQKSLTLFSLTWPIFIEIFLHMLMGNADTLMLSQYSDDAVASVGVSNQLLSVVTVMFGFVATGAGILVAQNLGANDKLEAGTIASSSLSLNLLFSLVMSLGLFLFSNQLLLVMDLPKELLAESNLYIDIVGGFIFIQALMMTAGAILRNYGFTKDAMYVTIGMNLINVVGNYLFIFGPFGFPVLGVQGVAISTAFSRLLGLVALTFLLVKRKEVILPIRSFFHYKKKHIKNLLHIGIPSAGEQLSYNASQMAITYFIAQMGTVAITTKVYAQNIMMFIFLAAVGIAQGTQILVGHDMGAQKVKDAYIKCMKSTKIAILISVSMALIVYTFSDLLLGLFTNNPSIIEQGSVLLLMTVLLEPGRATNLVVIHSLRGAGDVKFPVIIGILSMWGISVTFAWFFGLYLGLGLIGIWIGFIADEWLRGIIMVNRWRGKKWTRKSFV